MEHANGLHRLIVGTIEDYRRSSGEPPTDMQAIYDWLHKQHIEHTAEIKTLLADYNK